MIFFILSVSVLLLNARYFLPIIEKRQTLYSLNDPILSFIEKPIDCNLYLSLIHNISILLCLYESFEKLENILTCFAIVHLVRDFTLFLVPLSPPENTIYLEDPFLRTFTPGKVLTKDLFFSGHTSFLFLIFYFADQFYWIQCTFFVLTLIFLILQKVHYTIDIFIAPFMCYCVYQFWRNNIYGMDHVLNEYFLQWYLYTLSC